MTATKSNEDHVKECDLENRTRHLISHPLQPIHIHAQNLFVVPRILQENYQERTNKELIGTPVFLNLSIVLFRSDSQFVTGVNSRVRNDQYVLQCHISYLSAEVIWPNISSRQVINKLSIRGFLIDDNWKIAYKYYVG